MPIKWSPLMVSEAMDMVEEYVNHAIEPLEQAKLVALEARKIPNLPGYIDQHLSRPLVPPSARDRPASRPGIQVIPRQRRPTLVRRSPRRLGPLVPG